MKKIIAAALAATAWAATAWAATQDFVIVNKTGYPIEQVYVSASKEESWEEDVLGRDILPNRERVKIEFDGEADACLFDLKVVYADEETAEWAGINLCQVSTVILSYNRKTGETWAETE